MNIILWNCRGALNLDFKRRVMEILVNHFPVMLIITETRVGGVRAAKIIEELPFDGFFATDTIGYAGGLWLLWKKEEVEVFVLSATEQEIHATVKVCHLNLTWLISPIYASPRVNERRILWANLMQVAKLHNLPWLLLGDFNEVLCGEDKFGGRGVNLKRALDFKECLDSCNLIDLRFSGPKFTWSNSRQVPDLILERIDRCFANPNWRLLFPEASVTHLSRVFSDHCPVLLELSRPPPTDQNRPFRFQIMWIHHPEFPNIVKEAWELEANLNVAIKKFTESANHWNRSVFGNLFTRKRRVLARLYGVQKALAIGPSQFLVRLEKELAEEYLIIMQQEEEYWALKSRLNWAIYGNRNTSFFHVSTLVPCSSIWTAIKVGFPVFEKGICWNVGSNSNLKFWEDKWVKGYTVRELIEGPLNQHEAELSISDMFHLGSWCWDKISFDLLAVIREQIRAIPMQLFGDKEDTLAWKYSKDGLPFCFEVLEYASNHAGLYKFYAIGSA
ncbi:putative ribonuclease h protein [Quercus suber]|uniref:Ribonuclease h protein n=1 Tax=Quercus suber TaxID=58331 RepID=A0AAW0KDY5_QUESU